MTLHKSLYYLALHLDEQFDMNLAFQNEVNIVASKGVHTLVIYSFSSTISFGVTVTARKIASKIKMSRQNKR